LDDILALIRMDHRVLSDKFKVARIGVFGSYSRNEHGQGSDIDILVELTEPIGLSFIDLKDHLEQLVGKKVDLVSIKALRPEFRKVIMSEVVFT